MESLSEKGFDFIVKYLKELVQDDDAQIIAEACDKNVITCMINCNKGITFANVHYEESKDCLKILSVESAQ